MQSIDAYRETLKNQGVTITSKKRMTLGELAQMGTTRMSAERLDAPNDVPPFENSHMDGFVVDTEDPKLIAWLANPGAGTLTLPLQPLVAAGQAPPELLPGHAMPIMTGAMLPPATAGMCVVPVENTVHGFTHLDSVTFQPHFELGTLKPGRYVRQRGSDIAAGQTVLDVLDALTPARLGVLASLGIHSVTVYVPPRVLLVTTGDELVEPGSTRGPAQIFDTNRYSATAAINRAGGHVVGHLHVRDDPHELLSALSQHHKSAQGEESATLVISMGGISKGAREVVRLAAEVDESSAMEFTTVAMQPGGPQAVGRLAGLPWVGLPGNPVSTLVSIHVLLRGTVFNTGAVLRRVPGRTRVRVRTPGGAPLRSPADKTQFRPARRIRGEDRPGEFADGDYEVASNPSSHLLHTFAESDVLVVVPAGVDTIYDGDTFNAIDI